MNEHSTETPPRRRKLSRGVQMVIVFVALFLVLQIGESIWRAFQPEGAQKMLTATQAAGRPVRPTVRVSGRRVIIEYRRNRTRIGLDEDEELEALATCVRERLEDVFGPLDADGPLPESAAHLSRQEARRLVDDTTEVCMAGKLPPIPPIPEPPLPPSRQ